ncbi:hypothetical protein F0249_09445 [Vibrio sp. 03-59-1]|uniref:hypothetical protein n=1 Tax=Vibrio sp. 03-59-1 TaxID=2607607 RepID=UPI0014937C76|nr:hypothetical protein [Vibrio sp. 03-59-1]NOH84035.1 hypothetical protein [Vibrio sp. 03-59-1]
MPKLIHTIWITTLALVAMLTSSMFSTALANSETIHFSNSLDKSYSSFISASNCPEHDKISDSTLDHHCCGSICLIKIPSYRTNSDLSPRSHSLALIPNELSKKAVLIANSVYRPPIV